MSKKYKFAIIGCGVIAPHHANSILALENTEITAVCDIIEEKASAFAERYNVKSYYTDYKKLIDEADIDIVNICVPSGLHGEVAIYAANAKKHIFCEKPIEITRSKMDAMIAAVNDNGVKMGCVFQMRTSAQSIAVKKALDEKKFGNIVLADAYLKYNRTQAYYDSAGWRGTWELDGGGALMNQGVHGIDLLMWLAGEVESVFARAAALARNIVVEDTAVALLKFKNGAFGVIEGTTSVYPGHKTRLEIHGEKGTVSFDDDGILEWAIEGKEDEKAPEIFLEGGDSTHSDPTKIRRGGHLPIIKDLIEAIEEDRTPMIPPEDARKAVDLILAIYESAQTGKEVKLS